MEPARTPKRLLKILHLGRIAHAVGQVPQDVQGEGGRGPGEPVHLGRVGKLFFQ